MINKIFNNKIFRPLSFALCSLTLALGASSTAFGAATITILNNDAAGVGFNDATVVAPVGGNTGTTLGQQRLIAFQAAASKWGATLDSTVTITIRAQWTALTCTATTAVLGSAGAIQVFRDFGGAPFSSTFYPEALTGKLTGADPDPTTPEINANFNVNLGNAGCLTGTFFYLGLDNNHGANVDLVTVLTHEFGHGLGFQTFTNGSTGAPLAGFLSMFDHFLMDLSTGKSWLQMTNAERATSALNTKKLAWNGPQVTTDVPSVLALGTPFLQVNSPAVIAGSYDVGTASFGAALTAGGVTGNVIQALDLADGTGPLTTDGCTAPLTNAAALAGNIAIIDRGTCGFTVKVKNAQDAGAIAVIIADNVAGSPPAGLGGTDATITIPSVRVTLADGNTIKGQLGTGVNSTLKLDTTVRAGADLFGKALLYTPNPFQSGSSVSHWDVSAFPNLLMEPAINGDLTHEVTPPFDLTFSEMRDIGWVASVLPTTIAKTTGDNQNTGLNQPFVVPFSVTVSPAVSGIIVTWTVNPNGSGAGGAFPSTTSRFAVSTTNALGVATAPALTANGQPGLYSMNATVPGAGTTTFALQNDSVPVAGGTCFTDTTQADFQAGVATNTDVTTSPGDVILLNPANVDQQNQTLSGSGVGITTTAWGGQTFTPSVTGQLARADINLFCAGCTGTAPIVTVSVRTASVGPPLGVGLPTGPDLASTTFTTSTSGAAGFFTASFASPATLTAGTPYALVIRNATNPSVGTNAITRSATDVYAGGQRVASGDSGATWSAPLTAGQTTDIGFITYMKTGNAPSGDFVSSLKDSNPPFSNTFWSTLSWTATVPTSTNLQFQVAGSNSFAGPFNFVGPSGTAATFFTTSPANISQFNGFRYLKYKAFFTTGDATQTPTLNDVTVCENNPPTAAPATISGRITTADGAPLAGVVMNLSGATVATAITDSNGSYLFANIETDSFYTVTPALVNYQFSPASRSFSLLGSKADAVFTAVPDALPTGNPIDTNEYFVRQQYRDFLGREPDQGGLAFWTGKLNQCNGDAACLRGARIDVSAAFFQSEEFGDTGSYVYRVYQGALGRQVSYEEFASDRQQVVGGADLAASKAAFASTFVTRAEFAQKYQGNTTAVSFVEALLQTLRETAGVDLSGERANLLSRYNSGATLNEDRALVLREVGDNALLASATRNPSFVLMEYFGYLRRGAEAQGYAFWLNVLNTSDAQNYRGMVCSFLTSSEYQHRFGTVISRNNSECSESR